MLVQHQHSGRMVARPSLSLVEEAWATEVVPRLPAHLAEQARTLQAFQRVRGVATPHDLLRGVLAYVLGPLSTRRLGAWAVLVGLADISEAAWRKRLRASSDWLLWLLGELGAVPEAPAPSVPRPAGRLLLVEASCLRHPGGAGDDWRLHLAYDLIAGRMHQVSVTDRRGGEHLARYRWQAGEVIVADRGDGYRRSVAMAVRQQADVVVRIPPATFPLATDAEQPFPVLRWLRQRGSPEREWTGWGRWQGQRYRVRLIAAKLDATATQAAVFLLMLRPRLVLLSRLRVSLSRRCTEASHRPTGAAEGQARQENESMDGCARTQGIGVPGSLPERRVLPDRRARPTTLWGALRWRGRRRGFRRAGEGHGTYVDCLAPHVVVLTLGVFLASLVDAGLTLRHLAQGGSEANTLMAWVLTQGDACFLWLKIGITGLGVWFLAAHQQFTLARYGLSGLGLVYGALLGYYALFLLGSA